MSNASSGDQARPDSKSSGWQAATGLEVRQQVEAAMRTSVTPGDRADQADAPSFELGGWQ